MVQAELIWLPAIRRYLVATAIGHLAWEVAHLPLYTLWQSGSRWELTFAVLHCTAGDVLIAAMSLIAALVLVGTARWPHARFWRVACCTMLAGFGYTLWSEYLNTVIRQTWTYTDAMAVLPWLGVGVTPLLQWVVVPAVALWLAGRTAIAR